VIGEATVIAVAAALYLADCIVLLERGQAVLLARGRGRAGLQFGSVHYQMSGKAVALLNPLTPFFAAFRSAPLFAAPAGPRAGKAAQALSPLGAAALIQLLLVFAALPYCLYRAPGWPFVIALALAYVNAIVLLVLITRRMGRLGVSRRPLWALGFGWLACLPLSVNAVRRAGLAFELAPDARKALRFLPHDARENARAALAAQIEESLQELEEGDAEHARLAQLKQRLEGAHGRV
jgi:hypothetical protein